MNIRGLKIALPLGFVLAVGSALASEEESLEYSEIRIAAPERKDVGKVVFAAKVGENQAQSVRVEAFGKKYELSKVELEKLAELPLSSLGITHEAGYERTGGHTVYFKFKRHRYQDEQLMEEKALISVSIKNGLSVKRMEPKAENSTPAKQP